MDILFFLDNSGLMWYIELGSIAGAIFALWESIKFQWECRR